MLYDADSKDPPSEALIQGLYEASVVIENDLACRAKFMQRMQRRHPGLTPGDTLPGRKDGQRFESPESLKATYDYLRSQTPAIIDAVESRHSLKEQEKVLFNVIESTRDSAIVDDVLLAQFSGMMGVIDHATVVAEHIAPKDDTHLKVSNQRIKRYADNAWATMDFIGDLTGAYQKKERIEVPHRALTPYQLALMMWVKKHDDKMPSRQDRVTVRNNAIALIDALIEPYKEALPENYSLGVLGIVGQTSTALARNLIANDHNADPSKMFSLIPVQTRTVSILRDIFRKHSDVTSDPEGLLNAQSAANNALCEMRRRFR